MKTTLFLMTNKGFAVLRAIIENNLDIYIDNVIVGIDKSVKNDYSYEIIEMCKKNKLVFFLSNQNYKINSSYGLAVSWRWIIDVKDLKLIVLHDSLLPKYRGFAPLVNCLINGEDVVGVTALLASKEYDKGDIILQKQIPIYYPIKVNQAIAKVSLLYSEIVLTILKKISLNIELESFPQNEDQASYSLWLDKEDYFINWNNSSSKIKRFVDAVGYPYQGAKCFIENEIVVLNEVSLIDDLDIENRHVGKVIFIEEGKPIVVCGQGLLKIEKATFESSKKSVLPLKKMRTRFK